MFRKIFLYKDRFLNFYLDQKDKVKLKIDFVLDLIRYESNIPNKFLKNLMVQMGYIR